MAMAHQPRRILPDGLYEITTRTFQGRYFFVPSKTLNQLIAGAMAYAQAKYDLTICATVWMSNHAHHLVIAKNETQVARFLQLMHEQVAKEVQRICKTHGFEWTGGIFSNRASILPVVGGARIQRERLKYLLSQGVKEGLVTHPRHWPGVHSAKALLSGSMKIDGLWVDRTSLYEVERGPRRRKKKVTRKRLSRQQLRAHQHSVKLELSPLPYQAEMTEAQRTAEIRAVISEILAENAKKVAMAQRYRKQRKKRITNPDNLGRRPDSVKSEVQPLVHADGYGDPDDHTWQLWMLEWEAWLNAYERASKRLRDGFKEAMGEFPEGCFLPAVPRAAAVSAQPP